MNILGFELSTNKKVEKPKLNSIELQSMRDPDAIHATTINGDFGVMEYNSNINSATEEEKIKQYRTLAQSVEVSQILGEIFNEVFSFDGHNTRSFDINFYDDCKLPEKVKKAISDEVDNLYRITNFRKNGLEWFKAWYIDSILNTQVIIDEDNPKDGIKKVIPIDPINLTKVRVLPKENDDGTYNLNDVKEYYLYKNDFSDPTLPTSRYTTLKISSDAVIQVVSGEKDVDTGKTIGYLNKTIVPYNNLKMMEESMIIYRVVRAPMRRVFYFDVSKMPPQRAEEYMATQMKKFKTRFTYNSKTGKANSQNHISSMLEDYYLPRMSEGRTTEIQTIDGQSSQDIMDEVEYLKDKLWRSGNVPLSRLQEQQGSFIFGRSTEIQRDEYKFKKFLNIIRSRFMYLYDELLKRQLILKNIISEEEWDENIDGHYEWVYTEDNAFIEWKEAEQISSRLDQLERAAQFSGKFVSDKWIFKNIMKFTDEEIDNILDEIAQQPKPKEEDY